MAAVFDATEIAERTGLETVGQLREALGFRCFHCLGLFSGPEAYEHFGLKQNEGPACLPLPVHSEENMSTNGRNKDDRHA